MLKFILLAMLPMAMTARSAVIISEVLFNEVGSDTTGEWIEIYNNGTISVDLTDWKIGDEETSGGTGDTEGMFRFPAGSSIGPGVVQVVAVSAARFNTVYGFMPTYEVGTGGDTPAVPNLTVYNPWDPETAATNTISMSNTNDQVLLLDPTDVLIDAANWGNTFQFNPGLGTALDGQSFFRTDVSIDTNTSADFAASPDTGVAATRSSPGVIPEPSIFTMLGGIGFMLLGRRRLWL